MIDVIVNALVIAWFSCGLCALFLARDLLAEEVTGLGVMRGMAFLATAALFTVVTGPMCIRIRRKQK